MRRAGYIADHAITYYDPHGTGLAGGIKDLASRIRQWGAQEWSQVPRGQARDLAARLEAANATALADCSAPMPKPPGLRHHHV